MFRLAEARLCHALAQESDLVIATGGGTLVSDENRQAMAASGPVVCLTAGIDTVLQRVEEFEDRPLLPGDREEKRSNIESLLLSRREAYARIALRVPTDDIAPDAVAERVLDMLAGNSEVAEMTRITVPTPEGHYHICIGEGILSQAGRLLANRALAKGQAAIVTNSDIAAHYAENLCESLRQEGYTPVLCLVPEGEAHKTLATVGNLYDQFVAAGWTGAVPSSDWAAASSATWRDSRRPPICGAHRSYRSPHPCLQWSMPRSAAKPASTCPRAKTS